MAVTVAFAGYLRRNWATARSYRLAFAMQLAGALIALYVIFQVSKLVQPAGFARSSGVATTYFAWIVVGLVVARLVEAAVATPATRIRTEQTTGTLEAVFATPISPALALVADMGFAVVRACLEGALLVAIAAAGFELHLRTGAVSVVAALAAMAATAITLASLGILLASVTLVAKQVPNLAGMISGILLIVSGLWFPIGLAPGWLGDVGRLSPAYWGLETVREALLGDHVRDDLLLALAIFTALAAPIALLAYARVVRYVRRSGSVALY